MNVQARKSKAMSRIDEMLLETAEDGLLSDELSEKITMRILGKDSCRRSRS